MQTIISLLCMMERFKRLHACENHVTVMYSVCLWFILKLKIDFHYFVLFLLKIAWNIYTNSFSVEKINHYFQSIIFVVCIPIVTLHQFCILKHFIFYWKTNKIWIFPKTFCICLIYILCWCNLFIQTTKLSIEV